MVTEAILPLPLTSNHSSRHLKPCTFISSRNQDVVFQTEFAIREGQFSSIRASAYVFLYLGSTRTYSLTLRAYLSLQYAQIVTNTL